MNLPYLRPGNPRLCKLERSKKKKSNEVAKSYRLIRVQPRAFNLELNHQRICTVCDISTSFRPHKAMTFKKQVFELKCLCRFIFPLFNVLD